MEKRGKLTKCKKMKTAEKLKSEFFAPKSDQLSCERLATSGVKKASRST